MRFGLAHFQRGWRRRVILLAFLPRDGRPLPSWLQMVVSSFSCSGIPTGDLNPIYNVPMLGTHKTRHDNPYQPFCFDDLL